MSTGAFELPRRPSNRPRGGSGRETRRRKQKYMVLASCKTLASKPAGLWRLFGGVYCNHRAVRIAEFHRIAANTTRNDLRSSAATAQ